MRHLIHIVLMMAILVWVVALFFCVRPKADPFVYTDANQCQYLVKNDSLTPRLNPNGTQVCKK